MMLLCAGAIGAGAALLLGWLGYPLILVFLTSRKRVLTRATAAPISPRGVTVIIATREPPEVVRTRMLNLRECDAPGAPVEIIVGVDACSPDPIGEYAQVCGELGRVVAGDAPGGKASTLNAAVRKSASPFLVFADSRQTFTPSSIGELLDCLGDSSVGAVTGTLSIGRTTPSSGLLKLFWAYELMLRDMESKLDSVVAVTGAIYALRKDLWTPLPAGLICDDLFVPMQVVRQGRRVVASALSLAVDDRHFTRAQEFSRKVRTLTGMIQFCALCPWALSPFRNRIWGQFVCHKLLRLSTPYLLLGGIAGALACLKIPGWFWPAAALLLLALTAVSMLAPKESALRKARGQLLWAGYLLVAPMVATLNAVRGKWDIWSAPRERPAA